MSDKTNSFDFLQTQAQQGKAARNVAEFTKGRAFLRALIDQKSFYIPVEQIREIVLQPRITPVGHVKPWLTGIIKIQGDIYSVIDLSYTLSLQPSSTKSGAVVALSIGEGNYALLVSSVLGIVRAYELRQTDENEFSVTYQSDEHDEIVVLSVDKLVNLPDFSNVSIF